MNFLAKLLGSEVDSILQNLTAFVSNIVVTKGDKAKIIQEIEQANNNIQLKIQDTITERHKTDMNSDSWLSKNIRPMVLISIILLFFLLSVFHGAAWLNVPESYITILKNWGELAFMFYFGSRGIEKIVSAAPALTEKLFSKRNK